MRGDERIRNINDFAKKNEFNPCGNFEKFLKNCSGRSKKSSRAKISTFYKF